MFSKVGRRRPQKGVCGVTEVHSTRSPQGAAGGLEMEAAVQGPLGAVTDLQPAKTSVLQSHRKAFCQSPA